MKKQKGILPMDIQFFAGVPDGDGAGGAEAAGTAGTQPQQSGPGQQTDTLAIDYTKIQHMLDGALAAKEETALKAYFKQQGLSQQEAEQAMSAFKAEKAKNQPDMNAMQMQLSQTQSELQKAKIENAAAMAAFGMGLDAKTVPYVLKMADFSQAWGQDGKISEEAVKNALNKVIEDIPALKPQENSSSGFRQVGAGSMPQQGRKTEDEQLKKAFGL